MAHDGARWRTMAHDGARSGMVERWKCGFEWFWVLSMTRTLKRVELPSLAERRHSNSPPEGPVN